jgi:hypothetical protein
MKLVRLKPNCSLSEAGMRVSGMARAEVKKAI